MKTASGSFDEAVGQLGQTPGRQRQLVVGRGADLLRRRTPSRAARRRCEGAVTPSLRAVEARAQNTAAQQEVALLASAGRSNKEPTAEELVLSLRTVENYLHRVYEKLGISGRGELAFALNEVTGAPSR